MAGRHSKKGAACAFSHESERFCSSGAGPERDGLRVFFHSRRGDSRRGGRGSDPGGLWAAGVSPAFAPKSRRAARRPTDRSRQSGPSGRRRQQVFSFALPKAVSDPGSRGRQRRECGAQSCATDVDDPRPRRLRAQAGRARRREGPGRARRPPREGVEREKSFRRPVGAENSPNDTGRGCARVNPKALPLRRLLARGASAAQEDNPGSPCGLFTCARRQAGPHGRPAARRNISPTGNVRRVADDGRLRHGFFAQRASLFVAHRIREAYRLGRLSPFS